MTRICDRCDEWLQELLDGNEPEALVRDHLEGCPACRELYDSAIRLTQGLAQMPAPEPAPGLEDRIVAAVLFDRKRIRNRRQRVARILALAAAVLLAFLVTEYWPRTNPTPGPRPTPEPIAKEPVERMPSLRQTVAQAGTVVAEVASRRIDEAVEGAKLLLPSLDPPSLPPMEMPAPLEPTAKPIQTAAQGVTVGLEPVTDRARRAFSLFVRDLTPGGMMNRPGL